MLKHSGWYSSQEENAYSKTAFQFTILAAIHTSVYFTMENTTGGARLQEGGQELLGGQGQEFWQEDPTVRVM